MAGHYFRAAGVGEYQAIKLLKSFLVDTVGWEVAEEVADTGTFVDVVFKSIGEPEVPNGFPRYIRLFSSTNHVNLATYETFISSVTNTGELIDATYGKVYTPLSAQGFELVAVADLERLVIVFFPYTGSEVYTGYVGRITPYHRAQEHNYPNIIKGSVSATRTWYYSSTDENAFMVGPHGSKQHYYAVEPLNTTGLLAGDSNDRDGRVALAAPVIINDDGDTSRSELVGEPRGMYRISPEVSHTSAFVKINGEVYVTFVQDGVHLVVGPIGTDVPPLSTDLST